MRQAIIFVDVKPSEQIQLIEGQFLCFASLVATTPNGVPGLKTFKNTRRNRKAPQAKKILEEIVSRRVYFRGIGVAGRMTGNYVRWAIKLLEDNGETMNIKWTQTKDPTKTAMIWNGHRFNFPLATGLALYTQMLTLMGSFFAKMAIKQSDIDQYMVSLDNLPGDSPSGLRFMIELFKTSQELKDMWESNLQSGVTFTMGCDVNSLESDGNIESAKNHPYAILVDWFAASCIAKLNPTQLLEESNLSSADVDTIASIANYMIEKKAVQILNIEDPILTEQVLKHSKK